MNRKKTTTLTGRQWINLRASYESGTSATALSKIYHVHRSTLTHRSKRDGWRPRGAMAVVAADRAGEKLAQTFEEIANEVCDRHIETFRSIHDLARLYLDELAEDTMMLIQRNSLIREQSEEFLDRGEVPRTPCYRSNRPACNDRRGAANSWITRISEAQQRRK